MPVTRSELLFLCGGAVAGVICAKNYDKIKTAVGPLLASAGEAFGDAYSAAARRVGEQVEAVQDVMAEAKRSADAAEANAVTAGGASVAAETTGVA